MLSGGMSFHVLVAVAAFSIKNGIKNGVSRVWSAPLTQTIGFGLSSPKIWGDRGFPYRFGSEAVPGSSRRFPPEDLS